MRGLYIHLPFCSRKCPYCNFSSYTGLDSNVMKKYLDRCIDDLLMAPYNEFDTIYIGGGTPSVLPPKLLDYLISTVLSNVNYTGREFSIEANPESVTDGFVDILAKHPISRVSLGIQSFNDLTLELLGRIHTADGAYKAYTNLKRLTNVAINADMIYDLPHTDPSTIIDTANRLVSLNPEHISAYSYSSEDTGYLAGGFRQDDTQFEEIEQLLADHGYNKYETSNFARDGNVSLHNMLYWNMEEYIGIGLSAASMIYSKDHKRIRYTKTSSIDKYLADVTLNDDYEELDIHSQIYETLVFGLRLADGVSVKSIEQNYDKLPDVLAKSIAQYVKEGYLEWHGDYLKTTKRGAILLDSLSSLLWRG